MFLYHFVIFYGTNLLTRCSVPVLVPVFCCLFVSEKLVREVSPNRLKNYGNYFYMETKIAPGGELQGGPQPPDATQPRPKPWPRLGPTKAPRVPSRVALSPINCLRPENPRDPIIFYIKHRRPPPSPTLDQEDFEALPGTLPEWAIVIGGIYTTMPASGVMRE